ncbi:ABC transporter permease DevC [Limnofasciculus baicalensis]|uniref:ABC transporter permease DevC n=1 Tax=Limnofasciculus baicalensis BBK-W-15 TaxID=2699891 RepID=A0AAE3GZE7_9CYAN|nr:ABC transporter permease DevC [Limnofasciculus baicalensis]MCP2732623.1 ABC transporter permease DevC [Limnofasciculus baicalensis BBK-W-15]
MILKIPLPWLQLTYKKMRFLVALMGIGFAVMLMFLQLGLRDALFDSAVRLHKSLQGDIILLSPLSTASISMESFSQRHLYKALGFEGVESVTPLYVEFAVWKNLKTRRARLIFVIGLNPTQEVLNLAGVKENIDKIKLDDVALFDRTSRPEFGPIPEEYNHGKTIIAEVNGHQVKISGLFQLGTSFGTDGSLILSDDTFFQVFHNRDRGLIDIGLIKLQPEANARIVLENMKNGLSEGVTVLSKQEYIDFEKNYWNTSTAIGFIFYLGAIVGFTVGTIIVYQILYADVSEHLSEYATLKAIGYTNNYLLGVVFQESLILASFGYIPGISISLTLYTIVKQVTLLPIYMSWSRALLILILTISMCIVSGAIAIQKLRDADPVDVF